MKNLSKGDISRIIEMAWSDEIPFESIKFQFGILEKDVVKIMRKELKKLLLKCGENEFQVKLVENIELKIIIKNSNTNNCIKLTMKCSEKISYL